jgi:threonine dehydratase
MIHRAAITAARRQLASQPGFLRTTPLLRLSGRSRGWIAPRSGSSWSNCRWVAASRRAACSSPAGQSRARQRRHHRGGNAGIAVAAAAKALGVRCEVFVPEVSPEAKRAWLRALGPRWW